MQDQSLKTIDATLDNTALTARAEKRYPLTRERAEGYWLAGGGINSPGVHAVSGPTQAGGTFNMRTDASDEPIVLGGFGIRFDYAKNGFLHGMFGVERHFADWTVTDTVSGATGTIDDYTIFASGSAPGTGSDGPA